MHIFIENTWAPVQVSKQAIYCKTVRRTWRTNFTRKKAAPSYVPGSPCQALSYAIQRLKLLSIHLPFRALCNTKSSAQLYHNNDATWCNQHGFESLHILPAVWNLSSLSIVLFQTSSFHTTHHPQAIASSKVLPGAGKVTFALSVLEPWLGKSSNQKAKLEWPSQNASFTSLRLRILQSSQTLGTSDLFFCFHKTEVASSKVPPTPCLPHAWWYTGDRSDVVVNHFAL